MTGKRYTFSRATVRGFGKDWQLEAARRYAVWRYRCTVGGVGALSLDAEAFWLEDGRIRVTVKEGRWQPV